MKNVLFGGKRGVRNICFICVYVSVCVQLSAEVNDCLICVLGIKLSLGPIQEHTINYGAIYLASSRSLKL